MPAATNDNSRRDFMKTSSLAALAGSAAVGSFNALQAAQNNNDDTIKLGLIGCGGRGTGAAGQAMNTSGPTKLVAVADVFGDRMEGCLRNLSRQHGDKVDVPQDRQFIGHDAYKSVLASDIDLVLIATPPGFRPVHFEAAVAAGKHIFAEKPLAVDPAGVRRIINATEESKKRNLLVQIGLQRRHERRYMETIKRLKDGAIGDIVAARAYWNSGLLWVKPRKPEMTEMEYQMRNWYYFNWLCGDHIVEQHIHNLDVINWLMGTHPVKAQGQGGRLLRTGPEHGEIFDHHFVEFNYGDNELGKDVVLLSQCRHMQDCWNSVNEYAHGSKGSCDIGGAKIFDSKGNQTWAYGEGGADGHQQEHHDLFADLRKGILPNEGEYGAHSTMTSIFGRMATYSGQELTWDEAYNSEVTLGDIDSYTGFEDTPPVVPNDDGSYSIPAPGRVQVI